MKLSYIQQLVNQINKRERTYVSVDIEIWDHAFGNDGGIEYSIWNRSTCKNKHYDSLQSLVAALEAMAAEEQKQDEEIEE